MIVEVNAIKIVHFECCTCILIRASLDYGEEVHWSKKIRGMAQYGWLQKKILAGVYTTAKDSIVKNFKHGMKK